MTEEEILSTDFVLRELDWWNVPGVAVCVVQGEDIVYKRGFGFRDRERQLPMTGDTLGGIASCSKSFASAVIASLVDEGKVDYDTPVRTYIPDFALMDPVATQQCTLRDMLYHRTGLAGHDAMWPNPDLTRREYLRRLRYLEPDAPFRSIPQYSNTIYNAIGCIAEEVTGTPYEELVEERILEPLGMRRTVLSARKMQEDADAAAGYFGRERTSELTRMPVWEMDVGVPAAGVCSSPAEMCRWLQLHMGNGVFRGRRLFSEQVMEEMHRPAVNMSAFPWHFPEVPGIGFYGMAWKTAVYRDLLLTYHCGEIEGYCSIQLFVPGRDTGMFLFCNRHCPNTPILLELSYTILDHLFGYPETDWAARLHPYERVFEGSCADWKLDLLPDAGTPGTALSHPLEAYTGVYENAAYGPLTVTLEETGLILHFKQWRLPMEHYHYDTFRIRDLKMDTLFVTLPMTYTYDEVTGKINAFTLRLERTVAPVRFVKRCGG